MSGTLIAPLFNLGPAITGSVLGTPYQQYRPTGPTNPTATPIDTLPAWITADKDGMGTKPFVPKDPVAYAFFDPTLTQVGDYLIGNLGTFFVASQDVPMPIQVVRCNQVVTISRPGSATPGPNYYGGAWTGDLTTLLTGWPASVIQGTKGERGEVTEPGDTKLAWVLIQLPLSIDTELLPDDWITTAQATPMTYTISACEQTPTGWRITASTAVA